MPNFTANDFFDLEEFAHRDLWRSGEPVWAALLRVEEYFQKRKSFSIDIPIPPNVFLDQQEQIAIGKNTVLEPGVYIQGPCILGEGCIIRHGAYLRSGVICGDHCVVGHGSEIKNSILLNGVQVAHLAYVGDSILGNRVNLGAGVKCANLRLDRKEVTISHDGEKIPSGLKKFGSVMGDGCQIGCNVVLNPGTLLGPECASYPLLNLHGVIPARTRIRGKDSELELSPLETAILDWLRK
jgi:UDP-N-acetylglucosamine diphosphorylase / glucose-1-phosphate thymidylyltransferase / UDP-N-acetylgalactosamine diphosphorylase / glucosamine-1-phosphate N-acetyltransferase / galactosamine-1-phosphate N-acetyltransferase